MSNARNIADITVGSLWGNRNLLMNGDFQVSQRGDYSTATPTTSSTYYLDRWCMDFTTSAACTLQRQLVTLPNGNKTYSAKITATGAASSGSMGMFQVVEDYRTLSGKQVTFSAWVKTNTSDVYFRHYSNTNVGSAAPSDGQWHYVTATYMFPVVTQGARGIDGTGIFIIKYREGASISVSAGDYIEIAQFQLELGSVATPFEYRPYGTELALCQRYYCHSFKMGQAVAHGAPEPHVRNLLAYSSNLSYSDSIAFPVPMRAAPSMVVYSPDASPIAGQWAYYDGTWKAASATNFYRITERGFNPEISGAGFTAWQGRLCMGHWVASAEL